MGMSKRRDSKTVLGPSSVTRSGGKGIPNTETKRKGEQPVRRREPVCAVLEAERRAISRRE